MRSRTTLGRAVGIWALLAGLVGGCASHAEPAPAPDWAADDPVGDSREVRAHELWPEVFADAMPVIAEFEREDGTRVRIATDRGDDDGSVVVTEHADGAMVSRSVLKVSDAGVALERITNAERGTITEFRPAMVLVPMQAVPGDKVEQTLAMIVHPADDPERVQNRGTAEYTLEYRGRAPVRMAGGRVEAAVFVERLEASFAGASVLNIARKWYAPGRGMVARQAEESVSVLGLPGQKKVERTRRAE